MLTIIHHSLRAELDRMKKVRGLELKKLRVNLQSFYPIQ